MDILVTGAGGFSGSHLVPTLLARGHRVTALVGRTRGRLAPSLDKNPDLTVIACDLAARPKLPPRMDVIVHAAARSPGHGVSVRDMVRDNVDATAHLLAYARTVGVGTFVYFSSLSIHGVIDGPTVDPATAIVNPDAYGTTKFLGELMLREVSEVRSLSVRLPGVLGPNSVRNWLTSVIDRGRKGLEVQLYNPDAPFNNAIHVDDLCSFVADVLERQDWHGHDAVTVGAEGQVPVREAVEILLRALDSASRVSLGGKGGRSFIISNERAQEYGYIPLPVAAILERAGKENRWQSEPSNG